MRVHVGFEMELSLHGESFVVHWGKSVALYATLVAYAVLLLPRGWAQVVSSNSGQQSGIASGSAYPPVLDSEHRPITAGGFVDDAPVVFRDITNESGLNRFHHRSGTPEKTTIIETPGSGVALLDYDNDGWLDIYLVNGSTVPALKGKEAPPSAMLLHNNHDGTFTDVTQKAGVANERWDLAWRLAITTTMAGPTSM